MAQITLKGTPFNLRGELPKVGDDAPDFNLTGADLGPVNLGALEGKTKVIVTVPSLDTPVCQTETRTFNEKAAGIDGVEVLVVSADLPFAMKRFCETEGIDGVTACSTLRDRDFGERYGVTIGEGPLQELTARAVIVVGADNKVKYVELVTEVADQPDYDKVLEAAKG